MPSSESMQTSLPPPYPPPTPSHESYDFWAHGFMWVCVCVGGVHVYVCVCVYVSVRVYMRIPPPYPTPCRDGNLLVCISLRNELSIELALGPGTHVPRTWVRIWATHRT